MPRSSRLVLLAAGAFGSLVSAAVSIGGAAPERPSGAMPRVSDGAPATRTHVRASATDTFPVGVVIDSVVSVTDPTQSYALYLPSAYDPTRVWPVVYLLDPRGRALIPMRLFEEAAERHGWIVISSYNTLSDGAMEPNEVAMDAMLGDTQQLFAADLNRLYLCGFSGTARAAWLFAHSLAGHVAGVIGVGGGLAGGGAALQYPILLEAESFSFFGSSGTTDFNYDEMVQLDNMLVRFDIPHRLEIFDGPHSWFPKEVAAESVSWLELQAMKAGLRPADLEFVDSEYERRLGEARALEAEGRLFAAARSYRAVVEDFTNLLPIEELMEAADRAKELERSDDVKDIVKQQEKLLEAEGDFGRKMMERLEKLTATDNPEKEADKTIRKLKVEEKLRRATSTSDTADAQAAQRMLESLYVQALFYMPRRYLGEGDPERALATLRIARAVKPDNPRTCFAEARAHAAAGHAAEALDALECLIDSGRVQSTAFIESDQYLQTLRGESRYTELLERARSSAAASSDESG